MNAWTGKPLARRLVLTLRPARVLLCHADRGLRTRVHRKHRRDALRLRREDGQLLWARRAGTYVYTAAAVWKRRVYVGTYDGYFRAFDAATGDPIWSWTAPAKVHGAPTVMAGLVYFSTASTGPNAHPSRYVKRGPRGVYALDARTGKLVWQHRGIGQYAPIVADEERVYVIGSTRVYAVESRKAQQLARRLRRRYHVGPDDRCHSRAVRGDRICFALCPLPWP